MICIIKIDLYILLVGGSMQVFLLILILILYFIMWCCIKISSIFNKMEYDNVYFRDYDD